MSDISPPMRAYTSFPVDDDVVDRILCSCSDFDSIRSLALSCKSVYAVWKRHPRSIAAAVALNIAGPAWTHALRTARLLLLHDPDKGWAGPTPAHAQTSRRDVSTDDEDDEDEDGDDDDDEDDDDEDEEDEGNADSIGTTVPEDIRTETLVAILQLPEEEHAHSAQVSWREGKRLESLGHVAHILESEFSQRWKDSSRAPSHLSDEESLRFHRALHRMWAFLVLFSQAHESEGKNFERTLPRTWRQSARLAFIDGWHNDEIFELHDVYGFLQDMGNWVKRAHHHSMGGAAWMSHFVLIRGPRFLVGTTWQSTDPYTSFWTNEDPVIATLNDIGRQRKLVGDRWEPGTVDHAILKSSGDNMLTCERCNVAKCRRLYGPPNWHLLRGELPDGYSNNVLKLPGRLGANREVAIPLSTFTSSPTWSPADTMAEMFDQEESYDSSAGWLRTQRMCLNCVQDFLREHVVGWWRSKPEAGPLPNENCWYGWNCRTQGHKPNHAKKLNHLCVPIRGDP